MYAGTGSENYREQSIKLQSFLHLSCGDLRKRSSESCCSTMEYPLRTEEGTEEDKSRNALGHALGNALVHVNENLGQLRVFGSKCL